MLVGALRIGLTLDNLRHMKYTHVIQILWAYDDANGVEVIEEREAMQSDIEWLKQL